MPSVPRIDARSIPLPKTAIELPLTVERSPVLLEGVELFLRYGCLVIENAFDPDYIHRLHDEFTTRYRDYFEDRRYKDALDIDDRRTMLTVSLEGPFASTDFYAPARVFPLLEFLLSEKLIIGGMGCVISLPGSKDQRVHRDYGNVYDPGFSYPGIEEFIAKGPPYGITVGIPLVPITEVTGNTRFWPGSHLKRIRKFDQTQGPGADFVAEVGSCYLFDYRLFHSGLGNKSDAPRPLLYNIYTRPWFRDPINYPKQKPIDVTEEQLSKLPPRYQKLFSWALAERGMDAEKDDAQGLCYCGSGLLYKSCHGPREPSGPLTR